MEFVNGRATSNSRIMLDEDTGSLVIRNAMIEKDNGKYICSATNNYGKATASAFVTVTQKTKINTESTDIPYNEGSTFTFDCDVEVRPDISYH